MGTKSGLLLEGMSRALVSALLALLAFAFVAANAAGAADNPIVIENRLAGNPKSEWDVGSGDSTIRGFTTDISYNRGQTVTFKVKTNATAFRIDIYRIGYYAGLGARKVTTFSGTRRTQPNCKSDTAIPATGLIDCGNWANSGSWLIPTTATSGIYFAKLTRTDTGGASHAFFIVRDDDRTGAAASDVLFQTADTTWQAYNDYGGNSLYVGQPAGRAYKVSYNRPIVWRSGGSFAGISNFFNAEYPMVRWLEANGYDVSYFSGVDSDRRGGLIKNHKLFLSIGHDEYWSVGQRSKVEDALAAGVNLAFFSGNEVFWKTRWENSIDGSNTPYRTLVCYKETHAGQAIDPLDPPTWTGTWRDPRFSPPADGGRPENAVIGEIFTVNGVQFNDLTVGSGYRKMRLWRNTGLAGLDDAVPPLGPTTLGKSLLGFEWDEDLDNGSRPRGLARLSETTANVNGRILDYGSSYGPGPATHTLTLYRHNSGALVFGAGTLQWSWGLDANHDNNAGAPVAGPDVRVQQATVNLFADMEVQPQTLQGNLTFATISTDATPPQSTITSPSAGATVNLGSAVTVAGTATDTGGVVGGVEVSVNGGPWRPAAGRGSWNYQWVPTALGSATIRSAAVDDSGNLENPGASVTVNVVTGPPGSTVRIWSDAIIPATTSASDPNPVELGVKFASEVSGTINGIRFYKGTGNTGPHFGHLWQGDGTWLATADFTNETASGWQYAPFPSPVDIRANTTYIASYHTDTGHYSYNSNYFSAAGVDSPPLHALRDGVDGGNGVYAYGGSGFPLFPSSTFQGANYWVDVDFTPTNNPPPPTPPQTSIWSNSVVPNIISANDPTAVELGLKFRTDVAGRVTALRFYKGSANTGPHYGHLWAANGTLLATAQFTNETASGWQQVALSNPVAVTAGTTYIASYHTQSGNYSINVGYFGSAGVDSPPLYALQNNVAGPNGVFRYGPRIDDASGFPTNTYQSSNYWVDVVFEQTTSATALAMAAQPLKEDYKPRKISKLKYPLGKWKEEKGEFRNPLEPGAKSFLNQGKPISRFGQ